MLLSLTFSLVGERGVYPVEIEASKSVGHLKEEIAAKLKYDGRADQLKLFLAKTEDGAWLDAAAVSAVELNENGDERKLFLTKTEGGALLDEVELEEMDASLWLCNSKYFKEFRPEEGKVHVLVVPPKRFVADSELLKLQELLLRHALTEDLTSTSADPDFKRSLIRTYQGDMGNYKGDKRKQMLRCMLLDTALPSEVVVASHLFRHKNEFLCGDLMGFTDINDVKNGLLLFKPLKHAFDHFQISFIYDSDGDEFRLKLFDGSLRRQRLFGKLCGDDRALLLRDQTLSKHWKKRGPSIVPGTDFDIQTTFGDIEGRALRFRTLERPCKRRFNLQARLARIIALEANWIGPDEEDFQDFWSEGMSLAEKMQFFSERK